MKYNPLIHHRRSMRLKGYNYAQKGSYFITINCKNRIPLLGEIIDRKMVLSDFGHIAFKEWLRTPEVRPNTELGAFVIMPDHIHGIIIIREDVSGWIYPAELHDLNDFSDRGVLHPPRSADKDQGGCNTPRSLSDSSRQSFLSPSQTLGAILRGYMGTVTSQINKLRNMPGEKIWQRNYHDHIIRNKWDYHRISRYMINNPLHWENDKRKMA